MGTAVGQTNIKVRSGNRVVVYFGSVAVGLIQSVRMNDDYSPEPASGIGDIHVQENVPTMARHTLSVSAMVLAIGSLRAAGVSFVNGDDALKGFVFDFVLQDKASGTVLRKYSGCSFASGDVSVEKHAIMMNSGQFNCLDVTGSAV